jgi:hypothetical protein
MGKTLHILNIKKETVYFFNSFLWYFAIQFQARKYSKPFSPTPFSKTFGNSTFNQKESKLIYRMIAQTEKSTSTSRIFIFIISRKVKVGKRTAAQCIVLHTYIIYSTVLYFYGADLVLIMKIVFTFNLTLSTNYQPSDNPTDHTYSNIGIGFPNRRKKNIKMTPCYGIFIL